MSRLGIAALALVCLAPLPSSAESLPPCSTGVSVAPQSSLRNAREQDGVAVTFDRTGLALVPVLAGNTLNVEYGIVLSDRAARECQLALPAAAADGVLVRLPAGRSHYIAAEVGLCDKIEGTCVPVRVEIPRGR